MIRRNPRSLDEAPAPAYTLNMFKSAAERAVPRRIDSEATRQQILETALRLFRERGFAQTTMRDVAGTAGMSLGAAYYYFAGKDAIVAAYYARVQQEHAARCQEALARGSDLRTRLSAALHAKVDIMRNDRPLMRALFGPGLDPDHPLSWFGPATRRERDASIGLFADLLSEERLPSDLRDAGPTVLWALHMGVLLFFVYDGSPDQRRTRRLIDAAVDLIVDLRRLITSPLLRPVRRRVLAVAADAGLLPRPSASHA
jgi:AcrR family transcriptional regulator